MSVPVVSRTDATPKLATFHIIGYIAPCLRAVVALINSELAACNRYDNDADYAYDS